MTVIAAYLYRNGARVRPVSIDERIDCAHDKSEFVWIGVADPTDGRRIFIELSENAFAAMRAFFAAANRVSPFPA